jgi:hypothetical protein
MNILKGHTDPEAEGDVKGYLIPILLSRRCMASTRRGLSFGMPLCSAYAGDTKHPMYVFRDAPSKPD